MQDMDSPYVIRKIRKVDLPPILHLLKRIAGYSSYSESTNEEIKRLAHIFVVYLKNEIVGFGGLQCFHGYWGMRMCAVSPKHRGHQLQRRLIRCRVNYLRKHHPKAPHVNVWVSTANKYSMSNVRAEGFEPVDEPARTYHEIECIKLRKTL